MVISLLTITACGSNSGSGSGSGTVNTTIMMAAGYYHTLALKDDQTVWAWGYNNHGQLGDGTTTDSYTPVQVSGLE